MIVFNQSRHKLIGRIFKSKWAVIALTSCLIGAMTAGVLYFRTGRGNHGIRQIAKRTVNALEIRMKSLISLSAKIPVLFIGHEDGRYSSIRLNGATRTGIIRPLLPVHDAVGNIVSPAGYHIRQENRDSPSASEEFYLLPLEPEKWINGLILGALLRQEGLAYPDRTLVALTENGVSKGVHMLIRPISAEEFGKYRANPLAQNAAFFAGLDILGGHETVLNLPAPLFSESIFDLTMLLTGRLKSGRLIDRTLVTYSSDDVSEENAFVEKNLSDTNQLKLYYEFQKKFSNASHIDRTLKNLGKEIKKGLAVIYREFPSFSFTGEFIRSNAKCIHHYLNADIGINAYAYDLSERSMSVELGNLLMVPVDILRLTSGREVATMGFPITLKGRGYMNSVKYTAMTVDCSEGFYNAVEEKGALYAHYRLHGGQTVFREEVKLRPRWDRVLGRQTGRMHLYNFKDTHGITVNDSLKTVTFDEAGHIYAKDIVIPSGYRVFASGGTVIELLNGASFFSFSPVEFIGQKNNPIIIRSQVNSGSRMLIAQTTGVSELEHVQLINFGAAPEAAPVISGAVTFYKSNFEMRHCRIINSSAEDAINVVSSSSFLIKNTRFLNSSSDALDIDFSQGVIESSGFINSGNDAIDASHSRINVAGVHISGANDKGFSAGEMSRVDISNTVFRRCDIAVASKDLSRLSLRKVRISESDLALAVYQKKPEFGHGFISAEGISIVDVETEFLIEDNSMITVDGVQRLPSEEAVITRRNQD